MKKPTAFVLRLNRGLRTLLSWYRDYHRGKIKIKNLDDSEEGILDGVSKLLVFDEPKEVSLEACTLVSQTEPYKMHLWGICQISFTPFSGKTSPKQHKCMGGHEDMWTRLALHKATSLEDVKVEDLQDEESSDEEELETLIDAREQEEHLWKPPCPPVPYVY